MESLDRTFILTNGRCLLRNAVPSRSSDHLHFTTCAIYYCVCIFMVERDYTYCTNELIKSIFK